MKTKQLLMVGGLVLAGATIYFVFFHKSGDNAFTGIGKDKWESEPPTSR